MQIQYEQKPAMTLIGFSTTIRSNEGHVKCPEFWDKEYSQKYARLWQTGTPETPTEKAILENSIGMFGICACDEKRDGFAYWIAGPYRGGEVPEGFALYYFPESEWAIFSARGPLPGSLQTLSDYVWTEWYPNEGRQYIRNGKAMLEVYTPGDMQSPDYACSIWVPVKRK